MSVVPIYGMIALCRHVTQLWGVTSVKHLLADENDPVRLCDTHCHAASKSRTGNGAQDVSRTRQSQGL